MKGILKGLGWFLIYGLLTALFQQLLMVVGSGTGSSEAMLLYMEEHMLMLAAISNLLTGLTLVLLFCFRKTGIRTEWRLLPFGKKKLLYALILGFSYSLFSSLLTRNQASLMGELFQRSASYYGVAAGSALKIINLLLLAPIVEEIALRGIVYTRIAKRSAPWTAILISGILFGLMHFMAGGIVLVINAAVMGILMGFLLYRYDSLFLCIAAHAAANLPEFLFTNAATYPLPAVLLLEAVSAGALGFCLVRIAKS